MEKKSKEKGNGLMAENNKLKLKRIIKQSIPVVTNNHFYI